MKELSSNVKVTRRSYPGTGFAFYFVSCDSPKALRDYARTLPSVTPEPWFFGPAEGVPSGFTYCHGESVLPGVYPESAGGFLCCVYLLCVTGRTQTDKVRKTWWHEIGHAVDFSSGYLKDALESAGRECTEEALTEYPALCTEFLVAVAEVLMEGRPETRVSSGFASLFLRNPGEVTE